MVTRYNASLITWCQRSLYRYHSSFKRGSKWILPPDLMGALSKLPCLRTLALCNATGWASAPFSSDPKAMDFLSRLFLRVDHAGAWPHIVRESFPVVLGRFQHLKDLDVRACHPDELSAIASFICTACPSLTWLSCNGCNPFKHPSFRALAQPLRNAADELPMLQYDSAVAAYRAGLIVSVPALGVARTSICRLPSTPLISSLTCLDVSGCRALHHLDLRFNLAKASSLVSFRAIDCSAVSDLAIEGLTRNCQNLEELLLGRNLTLTAAGIEAALRCAEGTRLTSVDFSNTGASNSTVAVIAEVAPRLCRLKLASCCDITDLTQLSTAQFLVELDIRECRALKHAAIIAALEGLGNLESFHAEGMPGCDSSVMAALTKLPALEQITVSRCNPFPDDQLAGIAKSGIQSFSVAATHVGRHVLSSESFDRLQELDISGCQTFDDKAIRTLLTTCSLTALDISFCKGISGVGLGAVLACTSLVRLTARDLRKVRHMRKVRSSEEQSTLRSALEHLDLRGCRHVTPTICDLIAVASHLSFIDISECVELDDSVLRVAARALPNLRTLRARGCRFTEAGLMKLFSYTNSGTQKLTELDISGVRGVTARVMVAIAFGPSRTTLRTLKAEDCLALKDVSLLARVPLLTELDLSGCAAATPRSIETAVLALATTLESFRLLRYARISSLRLGWLFTPCISLTELALGAPAGSKWILPPDLMGALSRRTFLRTLALCNATGWANAASFLGSITRLHRNAVLRASGMPAIELARICADEPFATLSTLDVSGCSSEDLAAIASSLSAGCPALTTFSCAGREAIGSALKSLLYSHGPHLRALDLSGRPDVLATLVLMSQQRSRLTDLQLNGSGFTAISWLPIAFPRLAVLGVDGISGLNSHKVAEFIAAAPCIRKITGVLDLPAEFIARNPHVAFSTRCI
jgi:Leucine-rich repeat (LRR) protein